MKKTYLIALLLGGAAFLSACNSGKVRRNPGKIYAPDMVYSQAYDAFTENPVFKDGLSSQQAVKGTIKRGQPLPNNLGEFDMQGYYDLDFPKKYTAAELDEGKRLYDIHCGVCHGDDLDGQGPLYTSGKYASMPANLMGGDFYLKMVPGIFYRTIKYGKNMMGSYYSQLNEQERWEVIAYIKKIQNEHLGIPFLYEAKDGENTEIPVNEEPADDNSVAQVQ